MASTAPSRAAITSGRETLTKAEPKEQRYGSPRTPQGASPPAIEGRNHIRPRNIDEGGAEGAEVWLVEHHQGALRRLPKLPGHPSGLHRHALHRHLDRESTHLKPTHPV